MSEWPIHSWTRRMSALAIIRVPNVWRRAWVCRRRHNHYLRPSFASLLLHEGRSVISVARQLGHAAGLTLSTHGHVIDELEDQPRQDADAVIVAAREPSAAHTLPIAAH